MGETLHMLRSQGLFFFFLQDTSLRNIYNERRCNSTSALARLLAQFTTIKAGTQWGWEEGTHCAALAEETGAGAAAERRELPCGSEPDRGPRGAASFKTQGPDPTCAVCSVGPGGGEGDPETATWVPTPRPPPWSVGRSNSVRGEEAQGAPLSSNGACAGSPSCAAAQPAARFFQSEPRVLRVRLPELRPREAGRGGRRGAAGRRRARGWDALPRELSLRKWPL